MLLDLHSLGTPSPRHARKRAVRHRKKNDLGTTSRPVLGTCTAALGPRTGPRSRTEQVLPIPLTGLFPQRRHQSHWILLCASREKRKVPEVHIASPLAQWIGNSGASCPGSRGVDYLMRVKRTHPDKSLIRQDRMVENSRNNLHETPCWPLVRFGYKFQIRSIVPC